MSAMDNRQWRIGGVLVEDNAELDRVRMIFDRRPVRPKMLSLHSAGFRRVAGEKMWQRRRGDRALAVAKRIATAWADAEARAREAG